MSMIRKFHKHTMQADQEFESLIEEYKEVFEKDVGTVKEATEKYMQMREHSLIIMKSDQFRCRRR